MDKYEYKVRSEEISKLIDEEKYAKAAEVADIIDWRRVKSVNMLLKIAALYRVNRRNEDSKAILELAYERYPNNRSVIQSLCEVSIELDDIVAAVEYYKAFVKLSPNDVGVYTLRYRILEAQEASLEERIAILDELKAKDYQEEWGYELAYLYHRVGLATKCVEECDDVILWFGDGPYVMKAMELKMLHVPLTDAQQRKYETMLGNASSNYSDTEYSDKSLTSEEYGESSYGQDSEEYNTDEASYGADSYDDYFEQQVSNQERYDQQLQKSMTGEFFVEQSYTDASYTTEYEYGSGEYSSEQAYENGVYDSQSDYGSETYTSDEAYENGVYDSQDGYVEAAYSSEAYEDSYYEQNYYEDDQYVDERYYGYEDEDYSVYEPQPEYPQSQTVDMSQYNTINLQKVVAEGMEELLADERQKQSDSTASDNEESSTKVVTGLFSKECLQSAQLEEYPDNTVFFEPVTDEVSQNEQRDMLSDEAGTSMECAEERITKAFITQNIVGLEDNTKVDEDTKYASSTADELVQSQTGSIKRVIMPDASARVIKEEADMDELRGMTEGKVNQEHIRMEYNDENVYQTENEFRDELQSVNAQMDLENVLVKWERMKQENFQKHQDEVRQNVLEHTGKIFDNFNSSLKTGVLGELDRELAQTNVMQEDKSFLAADITSDIPQDRFDSSFNEISTKYEDTATQDTVQEHQTKAYEGAEHIEAVENGEEAAGHIKSEEVSEEYTESSEGYEEAAEYTESSEDYEEAEEYTESSEGCGEAEEYTESSEGYEEAEEYTESSEDYEEAEEYTESSEDYEEAEEYTESSEDYEEAEEYTESEQQYGYYSDEYYDDQEYETGEYSDVEYYGEQEYETGEYPEDDYYDENDILEEFNQNMIQKENEIDPEEAEIIAEMAKEDAMKTQEIKMNTADLSSLSEKILATTNKEAKGAKPEEIREFTPDEQELFENFAVTKKIKKQIIAALNDMSLFSYTGNVIITGEAGLDTVRMAKNLVKAYQDRDEYFSGRVAKIKGEKLNNKNLSEVFNKLVDGALIIEKANGMSSKKLYELAVILNQDITGIIVILEDTKKEIRKLFEKQAMIADYFSVRIDLIEMDINALVAYAKNYALALEYSIDEMGVLALYTRISNIQSGNHVVTKDEVREIIDEAIYKSKKSKIKGFVDVLLAKRYDSEDMIVLKERDFI